MDWTNNMFRRVPEYLTEEIDRKLAAIKVKWNRANLCGHKLAAKALQEEYEWAITLHYMNQHPGVSTNGRSRDYGDRWWS